MNFEQSDTDCSILVRRLLDWDNIRPNQDFGL